MLTWDDLIIDGISPEDAQTWIAPWSHLLIGEFAPIFMSKFGDWFLRQPNGSTHELSVIEGTFQEVAATPEEFVRTVNDAEWQQQHLLSHLISELHERGVICASGECYGFAPHPLFTGRIDINLVRVMSIRVWQSVAAQCVSQVASK